MLYRSTFFLLDLLTPSRRFPAFPKIPDLHNSEMASSCPFLFEEDLLCAICLDIFTDPIRTPCGHYFCRTCITRYWDTSDACKCPLCAKVFDERPEVSVDTFVSKMVHRFKNHKWKEEYEAKTEPEIQQMIQERRVKIEEVKCLAEPWRKDADRVLADIVHVSNVLISCIQRSQAELSVAIEENKQTAKKQAEGFIETLQREITQLEGRISELKQRSHSEGHLLSSINTVPPTKDWTKVNVLPSSYVGTVRTVGSQLAETLAQGLWGVELRMFQRSAVDVTLDPDTAHCELILSDDGKQVSHGDARRNVPDNKERFSEYADVLGKQSISSGRFYYEVQVEGTGEWEIGVVRESIDRKGENVKLSPKNGFWAIGLNDGNDYRALASPSVRLPVREKVQKVGVFVDYEEGLVSFYDAKARVHLYSFTDCTFAERLFPFFSPPLNDGGRDSAPLVISPVNL